MSDFIEAALWGLAGWSLRWAGLIVLMAVLLAVRPPRRPATRLLLCQLALGGGLLLPLVPNWWGPTRAAESAPEVTPAVAQEIPVLVPPDQAVPPTKEPVRSVMRTEYRVLQSETPAIQPPFAEPPTPAPAPEPPSLTPRQWTTFALTAVWFVGFAISLARLALGWFWLTRLRRRAIPAGPAAVALLDSCRTEIDARRPVGLAEHPAIQSPVLLGGWRPCILLPAGWDDLPEADRRAGLLHELAHLARRDDLWKLGEELVRAVFFFHPLVHWLLNRLDAEREQVCDAAVLRQGVPPRQYARVLLGFAQRLGPGRPAVPCGVAAPLFNRVTVKDRIRRLLEDDMSRWITPPSRPQAATLAVTVLALAAVVGGLGARAAKPTDPPKSENQAAAVSPPKPIAAGVVRGPDGRPVAGAIVALNGLHAEPTTCLTTQTDADGRFVFATRPEGAKPEQWLAIAAGRDGLAAVFTWIQQQKDDIVLSLRKPVTATGVVKDQSGKPVPGARVTYGLTEERETVRTFEFPFAGVARGTPLEPFFTTHTDSKGEFRLPATPDGADLIFLAQAAGMADLNWSNNSRGIRAGSEPATLTLIPEARIAGRVVTRIPGMSVGGLRISLTGLPGDWADHQATTDPEGRFTFTNLVEGQANLFVTEIPNDGPWTARAAVVMLVPGQESAAEIELIEGVRVEGQVLVRGTNKPVAGATVVLHGPARPRYGLAGLYGTTDAEGRYRFRVPHGKTTFDVQGPAGFTTLPDGGSTRSVSIPAGKTFTVPPLLVQPATVLAGRILDARDKPVPHARVIGLCRAGTCVKVNGPAVVSDSDGHFRMESGADGPFALGQATSLQVSAPDGQTYEVNVVAERGGVVLRLPTVMDGTVKGPQDVAPNELAGVVVDEAGVPLAGVELDTWGWVEGKGHRTGQDGTFRLKADRDANVPVRFRKPGYSPVLQTQLRAGVRGRVVVLDRKTYFEGCVLTPDGRPAAGARIRVAQGPLQPNPGYVIGSIWTETTAGPDGRYRLHVNPAEFEVQVTAKGGVARLERTPINHGEAKPLDFRLEPGVAFRAVVVDSQTGKPVPGVRLWHWQHKGVEGRSNDRGEVTISEMLPGNFHFSVEGAGLARWWSGDCVSKWNRDPSFYRQSFQDNFDDLDFDLKPGMAPVKIVVERGATVRGRVVDPDGKPVMGATVAPALTGTGNSLTGDTRFSVTASADGSFTVVLPASGAAQYNLVVHDGKYGEWRKWANGVSDVMRTKPGQVIEGVTLTLTRPATVRGKVVDARGNPVAYREVRAHAADKRENRYYDPTVTTREDGTFELRFVRPGEQFIQAAPFWLTAEEAPPASTKKLRLEAGQVVEGVVLTAEEQR